MSRTSPNDCQTLILLTPRSNGAPFILLASAAKWALFALLSPPLLRIRGQEAVALGFVPMMTPLSAGLSRGLPLLGADGLQPAGWGRSSAGAHGRSVPRSRGITEPSCAIPDAKGRVRSRPPAPRFRTIQVCPKD
jgi:hypothetical protein